VTIDGTLVLAGNSRLMHAENIKFSEADTLGTVIHVAIRSGVCRVIVIADEIIEDAADVPSKN
jgi:Cd2+/Zn2+-exporting ATPase